MSLNRIVDMRRRRLFWARTTLVFFCMTDSLFLWICAGVSPKLPGAPDPALSRDDPDRLPGCRPIPLGGQDPAATGTPAARSPSGRKRVRTWLGSGYRAIGGPDGPPAGSALSFPGQSATGQTSTS